MARRRMAAAVSEALEGRQLLADISSTYTWAQVAIGGGGWADGIICSRTDPNVRFVRNDTGQAYRWDAPLAHWIPMVVQNVNGGTVTGFGTSIIHEPSQEAAPQVSSFALDPNNNNTLYLYVQFGTTGGAGLLYDSLPYNVYKSTDGGRNFTATNFTSQVGFLYSGSTWISDTFSDQFRYDGDRLAVDPNNSNVVYIGTGTKGLWRSTNGGTDWAQVTGSGLPSGVDDMNVIPYKAGGTTTVNGVTVSKVLYLVTAQGNVYLSSNGGQSWSNISNGVGPSGQCFAATLDPNTGILYVPTTSGNLWKYSSGTWTNIKTSNVTTVTVNPNNSNILIAEGWGQVSYSTNGGGSWTNLSFSFAKSQGFAGNPSNPTAISVSQVLMDTNGTVWMVEGNDGILTWQYTPGTSASWTPNVTGFENFCGMDVALLPNAGGKAIVSVMDDNALVLNNLNTYDLKLMSVNAVLSEGTDIAVCPNDPNTFAVESYNYQTYNSTTGISTNGGTTFTTFASMGTLPSDLNSTQGTNLAISARGAWGAGSDHIVWLGSSGIPWYSTNGGRSWAQSSGIGGYSLGFNNACVFTDRELVADPFTPNKFYLYYDQTNSGGTAVSPFFVSTDGGATWAHGNAPAGNPGGHELMTDNVAGDLWLQTLNNGLYHSTNSGSTWTQVYGNGGSALNGCSIAIGKGDGVPGDSPYTLYYLYANNTNQGRYAQATDYGIYRSVNGGTSWDRIAYWPDGMMIDGDVGDAYSMMSASWDTFGMIAVNNSGSGFIYGTPSAQWAGISSSNGNWGNAGNWAGLTVPGSTSGTTSTKSVTFNAGNNTWGNSVSNPIVIDSTSQNIQSIVFDDFAGNYYIGSTSGNRLLLSSGGSIAMVSTLAAANAIDTVNAPLVIEGTNGTYSFSNTSLTGNGNQAGTLSFGGAISGGASGNTVLTLTGTNTTGNTISGAISNGAASSLALVKSGSGSWFLSGNNTYTGTTTVTGGLLGGSGTVAGTVSVNSGGAIVAQTGNGGTAIWHTGSLTLASGSTFYAVLNSSTAGSGYDQVVVNGSVNLGGATLSLSGTRTARNGDQLTLISSTSAITGTFAGLAQGATVTVNGVPYTISYTGNSVVLTDASSATVPGQVTGLSATAVSSSQINLSWNAVSGATSYNVYRSTTSGGEGTTPIATGITGTTWSNTGLNASTTYYYKVAAVNSAGTGAQSAEASATTQAQGSVPGQVTGLSASAVSSSQINLSWSAVSGATSYNVYRSTASGGEGTTPVATGITGTSWSNTGLNASTTYYYKVAAVNSYGTGTQSAEASATTQAATGSDTVWFDDALPAGASGSGDGGDAWTWVSSNPTPYSGSKAHQSNIASGEHQHYFTGATATLSVTTGSTLFAYIYLDSSNLPSQVMIQWNVGGSWEHRAYWGANNLGWGTDGTNSCRYIGALPSGGQWVRLQVPASQVGLEGTTVSGMAFTLYGGRATWDKTGVNTPTASGAPVAAAPSGSLVIGSDTWSWGTGGQSGGWLILRNGVSTNGSGVAMFNDNGLLRIVNSSGQWYSWQGGGWMPSTPSTLGTSTVAAAPSGTLTVGSDTWSWGTGGQSGGWVVLRNGSQAAGGSAVAMFNSNGTVWVVNSSGQWYYWTGSGWYAAIPSVL